MNTTPYSSSDFSSECWPLFLISYWAFPHCAISKIPHSTSLRSIQYLSQHACFECHISTTITCAPALARSRPANAHSAAACGATTQAQCSTLRMITCWPKELGHLPSPLSSRLRLFLVHSLHIPCLLSHTALSLLCLWRVTTSNF